MGTIKKFVFFMLLLIGVCVSISCDRLGSEKDPARESNAGAILFQKVKDLEPDVILNNGTKVINRSGNNLLGMDIHGFLIATKKGDLQQMFFLGNGKDLGPDFEKGGIMFQTNNVQDSIYNSLSLNNTSFSFQRNNMDNSIIGGLHLFTKGGPTSDKSISYTQWGLGIDNEHKPNKIVIQQFTKTSGEIAFHIRPGSKVKWIEMDIFNSIEEALQSDYETWDTFIAGPAFVGPDGQKGIPGTHITILPN